MLDTAKKYCSILFDILEARGLSDVVCSPGSRNVPLLIAAAAHQNLRKHFVVDERSAAFLGLGLSLVGQKPVALVCTSGTALLNYAPAVAEAFYQGLPLIVISADRPIQWIDQDDSQTLRQDGAIDNFVKKSFSLPALGENDPEMIWYAQRIINEAFLCAMSGKKGPVHINLHISEPLNKIIETNSDTGIIENFEADTFADKEWFKAWARDLMVSKVMLVAGFNVPDSRLQKAILDFSKFPNVVVMAETISNLHLEPQSYMVDSVLTAYPPHYLDDFAPDIIISLGGALVSRKLKEYLRRNAHKCSHWAVGYSNTFSDPFFSLSRRYQLDPIRFFRSLNAGLNSLLRKGEVIANSYRSVWYSLREKAASVKNHFIYEAPWSELKAFEVILNSLPLNYNLCLSNGTSVRYAQIIPYALPHASFCNRGVSGIDGSLSTAIGAAMGYKGPTLLISGDLSLAYDIGALGIHSVPQNFKIIVINNQGGGIFRFIPSTSSLDILEKYLCQPPLLPLSELSSGYGWHYLNCDSLESLEKALPRFLSSASKAILEVKCDGISSAALLRDYMSEKICGA